MNTSGSSSQQNSVMRITEMMFMMKPTLVMSFSLM